MVRIVSQREARPPNWHADFLRSTPIIALPARQTPAKAPGEFLPSKVDPKGPPLPQTH
jgi:hypothetical protein